MLTTIFWVTFGITVAIIIFAVTNLVSYALANGVFTDGFLDRIRRIPLMISVINLFTIILYAICILTKSPVILWGIVLIAIQCLAVAVFAIIGINTKFKRMERFEQMCNEFEINYLGKISMVNFSEWMVIHLANPYNMDCAEKALKDFEEKMKNKGV